MASGKLRRVAAGLAITAVAAGCALCFAAGRTAAHALTIVMAAGFWGGVFLSADVCLPNRQTLRIRRWSAVIFSAAWAAILAFYAWHHLSARYVYIFDDSLYYYQQLDLANQLNAGLSEALHLVRESIATDYTYLPNLFMAPLFSLTDRSIHGFAFAGAVMAWTPLMYQLYRLTLRISDQFRFSGGRTLLLCAGTCLSVFALPLLHKAAAWCQINLLGVPFLLQTVYLSWDMDFHKPHPLRMTALFASVVMLTLMRRWFIFFLAGYLLVWGAMTAASLLRRKEWKALCSLAVYGLLCTFLGLWLLWPLFSRALQGNYVQSYSYWSGGGLPYELRNQSWLLGAGSCVLVFAGYAWGLLQRRSQELRRLSSVMLLSAVVALVLFTRIQNMNAHQSTILMPAYVLGLMLLFAMITALSQPVLKHVAAAAVSALLLFQWGASVSQDRPQDLHPWLSHISLKPPVRTDLDALQAVCDFVEAHCTAEHPALFLCNSNEYDRLTFVNLAYPDLSLREKVALDRIALPSDGLPRAWFSAAYFFVPTQVQTNLPGGTVERLSHFILENAADRYEVVTSIPFDAFDMLIIRRKVPIQWEEGEDVLALFREEDAQYPKVYRDRLGWFYERALT